MKKLLLLLLVTSTILSACSSYNYYAVGSKKADVSKYHTYAWVPGNELKADGYYENSVAEERIIESANQVLSNRGMQLDTKKPDLLIRYTAMVKDKTRAISAPVYYQSPSYLVPRMAYYRGYRVFYYSYTRPFPVYVGNDEREVAFEEGNIVIDLIDRNTSRVIWRGVAKGEVNNPEKAVNDLPKVIEKIFGKLPA